MTRFVKSVASKVNDLTNGKLANNDVLLDIYNYVINDYDVVKTGDIDNFEMYLPHSRIGHIGEGIEEFVKKKSENKIFWDIGANIGYYSLITAKAANNIRSFEPEKNSYEILNKNISINTIKNVETHQIAVSNQNGSAELFEDTSRGGMHSIASDERLEKESYTIDTQTIDSLVKQYEMPEFIKVDVEGAELKVLQGAKNTLNSKNIDWFIEVHSARADGYKDRIGQHGGDANSLYELLRDSDYNVYGFDSSTGELSKFDINENPIPLYWYATKSDM